MGNKDSKTHPADEEVTTLFRLVHNATGDKVQSVQQNHITFANGIP